MDANTDYLARFARLRSTLDHAIAKATELRLKITRDMQAFRLQQRVAGDDPNVIAARSVTADED